MIKIWSMKKNEDAAAKKKPKTSAAQIRVQKDLTELDLPPTMKTHFADAEDLLNFELTITPDDGQYCNTWSTKEDTHQARNLTTGMYKGGKFLFTVKISANYPHEPPKVKCVPKIYHPNLDLEGNVCLNILREDWKPVLSLNAVMVGLQYLFLEPNADDPLNKEAAKDLRENRSRFAQNVRSSMRGGYVGDEKFDDVRVGA
ncbi:BZ3500_MvSof-1268-A1-R1_Chr6-3g08767 [Microbotryum saponariae]|uniref:NEDD8-conjugating enzyme UBC12 n=1 Tax=Microbotryum saponariae TaxID=289078 RepID=A0A2X0LPQ0_9BASI|nr:BZ3500_MvSof-1268-A1-R1_Chr6-3g08767 [Microbotryum saponariae]SDA07368.1 BZ3501_MvSof-1269-A2-R1_Chr6-2g08470 [Microbotryum saponariae]